MKVKEFKGKEAEDYIAKNLPSFGGGMKKNAPEMDEKEDKSNFKSTAESIAEAQKANDIDGLSDALESFVKQCIIKYKEEEPEGE